MAVAGPLLVKGLSARGEYYLPLATTDWSVIEACRRGARLVTAAGGCAAMVLDEGSGGAVAFGFRTLQQAGLFAHWAISHVETFRRVAAAAAPPVLLTDVRVAVEANTVHLYLEFAPGDIVDEPWAAVGAVHSFVREHSPMPPLVQIMESAFPDGVPAGVRPVPTVQGRRVSAEVIVPPDVIRDHWRTTPDKIVAVRRGLAQKTPRPHGRLTALTALFLACGQDIAAAPLAAAGHARYDVTPQGELYAGVTLPRLRVGTVGGATDFPGQRACLELLGVAGPEKAPALAEVCAALCLAADLVVAAD